MERSRAHNHKYIGRAVKSSQNSLTLTVWCTMSLYCLDRVLLVISTSKFCRGSGATSSRQGQWFLHHDNAPSHTALVVSPNYRTLRISLRVPFWLFPALKMGLKGTRFATMEDIKSNVTVELRKIPTEAFRWCFNSGRMDGGNVFVCARVLL
jgi:hypothetical protein